jgi:hypothetical protein
MNPRGYVCTKRGRKEAGARRQQRKERVSFIIISAVVRWGAVFLLHGRDACVTSYCKLLTVIFVSLIPKQPPCHGFLM